MEEEEAVPLLLNGDGVATRSMPSFDKEHRTSTWTILGLNSFAFAYGLCVSSFGLVILPEEALRLFHDRRALMLGVLLGLAGLSQLCGPAAGFFCDRHRSPLGRRRPWLLCGAIIAIPGVAVQFWASYHRNPGVYVAAFFIAMNGLNIMYVAFSGLLPDLVRNSQMGEANGVMGLLTLSGACLGFVVFAFTDYPILYSYPFLVSVTTVCLVITWVAADEPSSLHVSFPSWTWKDVVSCYWVDRRQHSDFFWVFISRMLYYCGISCQTFMLFFFRDYLEATNPQHLVAVLALLGQVLAGCVAYPLGRLSDGIGRIRLVYLSCVVISAVYLSIMVIRTVAYTLVSGGIYGMANGTYLAVDFALAVDALPSKASSAKFMAVWGVAAFVGTMAGSLINGSLLYCLGGGAHSADGVYGPLGYQAIMVAGAAYMCLSALAISRVTTSC